MNLLKLSHDIHLQWTDDLRYSYSVLIFRGELKAIFQHQTQSLYISNQMYVANIILVI